MDVRARFSALHESGCFVIPNPWDIGSARLLEHLGFRALATTSAGFAFSRGLPDRPDALAADDVIAHARELAQATSLPVHVDFQAGYAPDPDGVAENVKRCAATGIAGLSIEDLGPDGLYDLTDALARLRAARAALDGSGVHLTARSEAFLVGHADAARIATERLVAFAEAGADCLFAPGVRDLDTIRALVKAVAPKPLNVLVSAPGLRIDEASGASRTACGEAVPSRTLGTVDALAEAGVRRVSVGSALARVAWGAFLRAARALAGGGSFDAFADAASFAELNRLFG